MLETYRINARDREAEGQAISILTHPAIVTLRNIARRIGVNRLLGRLWYGNVYERPLAQAMAFAIRPGDCVWDVGANIGHYTQQFSQQVGPKGLVYAFEPDSSNAAKLKNTLDARENVRILSLALSNKDAEALFARGIDSLGATSRIVDTNHSAGAEAVPVKTATGDSLIADGNADMPNVIKIDVEGHEYAVLLGMSALLRDARLRDIFVEVHFGILTASNLPMAPGAIEILLRAAGFVTRWVDFSHLHAIRSPAGS